MLANRLVKHAESKGLLHTEQNAFRSGRDHVYCLSEVVKGRQRGGGGLPTYAFFLDVSKAYDTVWRDGLQLYKLWNQGIT